MHKLHILFLCLAAALLGASHAQALPAPAHITIHGHPYALELQENSGLLTKLGAIGAGQQGRHFRGRLTQQAGSWVRLSEVDGKWSGIVSLAGEKYLIEDVPANADPAPGVFNKQQVGPTVLATKPVVEMMGEDTRCAVATADNSQQQKPHSVLSAPKVQAVEFATLCATTIDGVCMFAEVEFVFDLEFQQLLGDGVQSTASAIVNMAEGFYESDFNIGFDAITMQFLSADVFSSSTDANTLLDDLNSKKRAGQLSFVQNPQAILHLVTGRNFDGGTAGIAFTDVLCGRFGVGTSQLLSRFGANQAALTALVVAHEIGHNFGASHDGAGDNNCGTGFIMEARVSSGTNGFSSCSIAEVEEAVSNIISPAQCFNFPVDVAISADPENVAEVTAGRAFTTAYSLQSNTTFLSPPQLRVDGSVPPGQGSFVSATLNGAACTVANGGQAYTCVLTNPGSTADLQVVALAAGTEAAYSHTASASGSTDLLESNAGNNQLVTTVSVNAAAPGEEAPPAANSTGGGPTPAQSPSLATTGVSAGGGGGGSFAAAGLLLLLISLMRRANMKYY